MSTSNTAPTPMTPATDQPSTTEPQTAPVVPGKESAPAENPTK